MAISAWVPTIWEARFIRKNEDALVWGQLVDRSWGQGEIIRYGNTIKIPTFTKDFTVRDYTIGTAIEDPEQADGGTVDLSINKQKYFNFAVYDINEVQTKPNIMDRSLQQSAYNMASQMDNDIKAEFITGYDSKREQVVSDKLEANTFGSNFLKALNKVNRQMDEAKLPRSGRWMVTDPQVVEALYNWLTTNGSTNTLVDIPNIREEAVRSGMVGNIAGFQTYVTNNSYSVNVSSKDYYRTLIGQSNQLVAHVSQIDTIEPYRREKHFDDAVKGLMVYGTKMLEATGIYCVRTVQAAA